MNALNGDKLRGHLETMVLSVLAQSDAHGMDILRRLEEAGCGLLRLKEGSLYPALYRLESAGLVKIVRVEEPESKRGARRRIYGLTAKGKRGLAQSRDEWAQFVRIIGGIVGANA